MIKILFVCHGNICRSPMAEFIMKSLVREAGVEDVFQIASAATSTEEIGNPVYPPARAQLLQAGISCDGKRAIQMTKHDYDFYDLLIGMDQENLRSMMHIAGGDPAHKIHLFLSFSGRNQEVADPWYSGNFVRAYQDILSGCKALLAHLLSSCADC